MREYANSSEKVRLEKQQSLMHMKRMYGCQSRKHRSVSDAVIFHCDLGAVQAKIVTWLDSTWIILPGSSTASSRYMIHTIASDYDRFPWKPPINLTIILMEVVWLKTNTKHSMQGLMQNDDDAWLLYGNVTLAFSVWQRDVKLFLHGLLCLISRHWTIFLPNSHT